VHGLLAMAVRLSPRSPVPAATIGRFFANRTNRTCRRSVFKAWAYWSHQLSHQERATELQLSMKELLALQADVRVVEQRKADLTASLADARIEYSAARQNLNRANANVQLRLSLL